MAEPLSPYDQVHALGDVRPAADQGRARASLDRTRQSVLVLLGLAALFAAGWTGLMIAGARPVGWGRILVFGMLSMAIALLAEAGWLFYLYRTVRKHVAGGEWVSVDAHWVGKRRILVLSGAGAVALRVRTGYRSVEPAVEATGRVWMTPVSDQGRTVLMVDQVPELLLAKLD